MKETSTIGALATAPAPAGIAVVRLSGPRTKTVLKALFRAKRDPTEDPRRLVFGELIDYASGAVIDRALAVYMPGPHSFTGEDVGEFQFHGSPLVVERLLRSLYAFGVTPAEPGEFTKRGFLNGKMDLVQAEAIADVINATSEHALKIAGEQLDGRFSEAIREIADPLRDLLAEMEASLDFPEEDIETARRPEILRAMAPVGRKLAEFIESYRFGHVVRDGFRVLIFGRPNVGKSSLLNLLLGRPRAIVTDISGTTRDVIEEHCQLAGHRFVFCDTAGITESDDTVEKIGIGLSLDRLEWADLVLLVADATDHNEAWKDVAGHLRGKQKPVWMVTNKIDLNPAAVGQFYCDSTVCAQNFYISVKTRAGYDALVEALVEEVRSRSGDSGDASIIVTNERQRRCLVAASESLAQAEKALESSFPLEVVSEDVRRALSSLDEIVGKTYTEDILGRIFSKFCIGK